ncbi:MAG TPA: S8 family serine peptidase, partial [Acidobacteriota bacterium]|nr:S8 family serine peptidase [Acidobacteriota bacterium]
MRYRVIIVFAGLLSLTSGAWGRNAVRVPAQTGPDEIRYVQDEFIVVLHDGVQAGLQIGKDAASRPSVNAPSLQHLLERHNVSGFRRQFPGTLRPQPAGVPNLATYYKVRVPEGTDLSTVIADFASDPNVDHVEKIGIHRFYLEPNDPYYDNPPPDFPHNAWHIKQSADHDIDGNLAWDVETGDATVVVGIMDSGVRYYHADLGGSNPPGPADNSTNGNIWVNTEEIPGNGTDDDGNGLVDDVIGYDWVNTSAPDKCADDWGEDCLSPDNDPRDFGGHGTAVAG